MVLFNSVLLCALNNYESSNNDAGRTVHQQRQLDPLESCKKNHRLPQGHCWPGQGQITFSVGESILKSYTDEDFAGDVNKRRSTTGTIFMINGGAVAWSSQQQKCVALSVTEAENVAGSMATKKIACLRSLLKDIGCPQRHPTVLLCNNQSAKRLVANPEFHQRTKHIEDKFHYIRSMQEEGEIDVTNIETTNQLADDLKKGLDGKFNLQNLILSW